MSKNTNINWIAVKNFGLIKEKHFPLRNLTILSGLNCSGKSTLIKSLLLFRRSNEDIKRGYLESKGELFNLFNVNKELEITVSMKGKKMLKLEYNKTNLEDKFFIKKFKENIDRDIIDGDIDNNTDDVLFDNGFQYLCERRISPRTSHKRSPFIFYNPLSKEISTTDEDPLGIMGEYTVHYLHEKGKDPISFENCLHSNTDFKDKNHKNLISQVSLWMGDFLPHIRIKTEESKVCDDIKLKYEFPDDFILKPENCSFGISNALSIITALLSVKKGSLLIIEHPEIGLHPKSQSQLGKLISLVSQNDVQVIIETHSDHILNSIRAEIKEKKLDKDKFIMFFFQKIQKEEKNMSVVTSIQVDKNAELSDYPKGLLDEWANQLMKLF